MTIHDLARLAGLNPSTVSRALRNDPRVRSATRERIAALAAEHGYVPNLNARNLADGKTRIIALLMGSLEFQVEREAAVCLNEIFSEHGYTLMILSYAPKAEELYPARLKILTQKICDGAILFTPGDAFLTPETRAILDSIRCPRVYLDRWFREYPLPTVTTDNTVAMRGLCDLAESAGMDGAVLFFHEHNTVSRDRKERLLRELKRRRIPHLEEFSAKTLPPFLQEHGIRNVTVFSNGVNDFRPLLPLLPRGFLTATFDRALPDDRSSYGPIFLCIQNFRKIAEHAADLLLRQLSGEVLVPQILTVPPAEFRTF